MTPRAAASRTAHDRFRDRVRAQWPLFVILLCSSLIILGAALAGRLAADRARLELEARANAALPLATASLASVIEKQRLIPTLLSRSAEVIALLAAPAPAPQLRSHLDTLFASIAADASAAVIYLIDREGVAIAASNANEVGSFVGSDYSFRTYFVNAMAEGSAQQYALGTVSGRPGLYMARRVDSVLGPLGVVVVKVEFDPLEARWRESGLIVQVTDLEGVVLATTEPAWRFGTTRPLDDEAAARHRLQLGDRSLSPVPVTITPGQGALIDSKPHILATAAIGPAAPGWSLTVFLPTEPATSAAARNAQVTALLAGLLIGGASLFLARRRRWTIARQAALAAMNTELEARVARRTEELNRSNQALATEITEREAAETRVRHLRDDLAQANRLSILGQVSAGVAHEINQPLAAIRAYAEAGTQLLDAGLEDDTRENLREIVSVTERIGAITQSLRGFARRGKGDIRPIVIEEAIDGAINLLAGRIRDAGVRIERTPRTPDAQVAAGQIRLEQILVNLLQNAIDAVQRAPDPTIRIAVTLSPASVAITVADNGSGIAPEVRDQLFMPFTTTKETGLGLGLVISSEIALEFGGGLTLEPAGDTPGTTFTLELPRAE